MFSSRKGEARQIFNSAFSVLKICTLLGLRYFACSALDDRVVIFKEPIVNKTLKGHVISSKKVPNEGSCRVNCYLNPDCVSINIGPLTEGVLACELNNARSGNEHTSALESKTDNTYLEIENPCSSSPCLNGGTCQAGFTSKGFRCQCINRLFTNHRCEMAKSCSHLKKLRPEADTGTYLIDPDGNGKLTPFNVTCNMTDKNGVGVTVISHDSENRVLVNGYDPPGSYSRDVHYTGASLSQLASLTEISSQCEQFIKYQCYHSRLFKNKLLAIGWWVSRNKSKMTYWDGASAGQSKCPSKIKTGCNCDRNDKVWREDSGLLTDKTQLPVIQLRFGDTDGTQEEGYHTLGKLKCYGVE